MANTVVKTTMYEGPSLVRVLFDLVGDGSGEATNVNVISRSAYTKVMANGAVGTVSMVEEIHGIAIGCTAALIFDATTKLTFCRLPDSKDVHYVWETDGSMASSKAGAGAVGDILITTVGLGAGDAVNFTIEIKKG